MTSERFIPPALALTVALCLGWTPSGEARLYQWVNPQTGTVELSGRPPEWYRSSEGGPRVQVFENGRLIDDTGRVLPPDMADDVRAAAFQEFERRQELEAVKRLERAARRERARREEERRRVETAVAATEAAPAEPDAETLPENLDAGVIDQLKSIIRSWDRQLGGLTGTTR